MFVFLLETGDGVPSSGPTALSHLARWLETSQAFFHPQNSGRWSNALAPFLYHLVNGLHLRLHREQAQSVRVLLHSSVLRAVARMLTPTLALAVLSKDISISSMAVTLSSSLAGKM